MKESKYADYDKYFETTWNKTKITRKAIKVSVSLKTLASSAQTVLSLTNLHDSAKTFRKSFASIAKTTRKKPNIFT